MDRFELVKKLELLEVNPQEYSLNGELLYDNIILYQSYHKWEVFYLDERGGRNDLRVFESEDEACKHIFHLFKASKAIEKNT